MLNVGGARGRDRDSTQGDGVRTPSKATMLLIAGEGLLTTHALTKPEVVIGRGSDCDVVVPSARLSRRHALLRLGPPLTCRTRFAQWQPRRRPGASRRRAGAARPSATPSTSATSPSHHRCAGGRGQLSAQRRGARAARRGADAGARVGLPGRSRSQRRQRAHPRRDRRRQGGARRGAAPPVGARTGPLRRAQLRRARRRRCSRASCSATRRARSPAPAQASRACSSRRTAAPCSSTRSASCRRRCRPSCCA